MARLTLASGLSSGLAVILVTLTIQMSLLASQRGGPVGSPGMVAAFPASVSLFSRGNKLEEKLSSEEAAAERSFQEFIHSAKPEQSASNLIGELKPNTSQLELMLLKNKIANTIQTMQEMEKLEAKKYNQELADKEKGNPAECYIEVTRVERVPGKCQKVNNGLPICQSDNYMAINTDCN